MQSNYFSKVSSRRCRTGERRPCVNAKERQACVIPSLTPPICLRGAVLQVAQMLDEFDTEVTEDELRTLEHGKHAKKIQSSARGKAAKAEIKQKVKLKDEETDRLVRKAQDKRELAMEIFARYDRDGSGTITFKELGPLLTDVLREHGCTKNLDAKTLEECFEKADTNHDNRIDFEEFVAWHNQMIAWGRRMNELERLAQEKQDKEDSAKYLNTPEATAMVYEMLLASGDAKAALDYKHNYKHNYKHISAERTEEVIASRNHIAKLLELDDVLFKSKSTQLPNFSAAERSRLADCFLRAVCPPKAAAAGPVAAPRGVRTNALRNGGGIGGAIRGMAGIINGISDAVTVSSSAIGDAAIAHRRQPMHLPMHARAKESKDDAEWQQNEFIREFEAEERRERDLDSLSLNEMQFSIFVEMAFGTAERHFSASLFKIFVRDTVQRKQSTSKQGALIFDELCVALRAFKSSELDVRAAAVFSLYDADNSGALSRQVPSDCS